MIKLLKFLFAAVFSVVVAFTLSILSIYWANSYRVWKASQWTAPIPFELALSERTNYGSTQVEGGRCGAVIHRLTKSVTDEIRFKGLSVLPAGLRRDDLRPYGAWRSTPMAQDTFKKFIYDPERPVGAFCSHGTWFDEWRDAALVPGNYYADNGGSLLLIRARYVNSRSEDQTDRVPTFYIGYFFN